MPQATGSKKIAKAKPRPVWPGDVPGGRQTAPTGKTYVPVNLTAAQVNAESGGKQFDQNGKPLIGRRSDGTYPKQKELAYGAGQIQIGTARETARKHGIVWDQNRMMNDKDYNLMLSDKHKGDLQEYYKGDKTLAIAAYHSGTGNVDRAIRQHGRAGFANGLGPDGRDYVKKLTGEGPGKGRGAGNRGGGSNVSGPTAQAIARNPFLSQGKESMMSETSANPIINPFKVREDMVDRAVAVEEDLAITEEMLENHGEKLNFVQESVRRRTEQSVAEKAVLLDGVQAENRALVEAVNPFLKKKQAVDTRLLELATMNPLERGLRGIFDLNYNDKYLQKVSKNVGSALDSTIANHNAQLSLTEEYLKSMNAEDENNSRLDGLTLTEMDQDSALMAQGLNASKMAFSFIGEQVNANENLIRAQVGATSNYLDGLDLESTNALLGEAMKSPDGTVEKAGVTLRVGELKQRVIGWEKTNLALESSQMAVEAGRMDLATAHATDWARNASEGELRAAAASNGNYKGMQIPMDVVLQQLAGREDYNNYQVEKTMGANTLANLKGMMGGVADQMLTLTETSKRIGARSGDDPQFIALGTRMQQLAQLSAQLRESGQQESAAPQLMAEFQRLSADIAAITKQRAERLAGGNPKSAAMLESYMSGQQLSRAEAIDGVVGFVEDGGLPAALRASPTFRAAYAATESATKLVEAEEKQIGKKFNKEARAARIREKAGPLLAKAINGENMKGFHGAIPSIAKQAGHPAGNISQKSWKQAIEVSDVKGYARFAQDFGLSGKAAQDIIRGTWDGKGFDKAEADAKRSEVMSAHRQGGLVVAQQTELLLALDKSPEAKNGFKPSVALIDYMSGEDYVRKAAGYENAQAKYGFGDFVAANAGDKGLQTIASGYAASLSRVDSAMATSELAATPATRQAYRRQPLIRTKAILGGIGGLQPQEEQRLLTALQQQFPKAHEEGRIDERNSDIRSFIVGQKFQDPELERIRKLAAKDWDSVGEILDRAIDRATNEGDYMVRPPLAAPVSPY